ncbi:MULTISPECIES: hypothetical protein [unclassified Streptomyces]|uniref:hypothetical protein n=1 Tax=unclassified Streptomyces TaxID=2593676 RepID=UPI003693CC45
MLSAYRAQPLIRACLDHPFSLTMGYLGFVGPADPLEHPVIGYDGTRTEYIREFTGSHPPKPPAWQGSKAYLADLPGDTILVRLHCHA